MKSCINVVLTAVTLFSCTTRLSHAGYVQYDAAVQSLNPVAYYHMSETEAGAPPTTSPDVASGGTVSDTATYEGFATAAYQANNVWGILGVPDGGDRAPAFSGSTGTGAAATGTYMSIPYSADLQPKVINSTPETVIGDLSVSFFIRKDNAANIRGMIGGWRNPTDSLRLTLIDWPTTGLLTLTARSNGAPTEFTLPAATPLLDNTLYHVVISLDLNPNDNTLSTGAIYINGVSNTGAITAVDNGSPGIAENLNGLSIGRFGSPGAAGSNQGIYWNGLIDEFAVFNSAITAQQALSMYNAALATSVAGDFDADGDVDGADFVAWQTHFPKAIGGTLAQGDADGDGDVDGADFVVWQTNFPFSPGPGTTPVPEPAAFLLVGIAATVCLLAKGRFSTYLQANARWNVPCKTS